MCWYTINNRYDVLLCTVSEIHVPKHVAAIQIQYQTKAYTMRR